jgi:hypothetical protein
MDERLEKLLKTYKRFFSVEDGGQRIVCLPSGHSFPARYELIDAFIQ